MVSNNLADYSAFENLTKKEQRRIVTPFEFSVSPELLGSRLATPSQRTCAIAVDSLLVAILAGVDGDILGLIIAIVFYRAASKLKSQHKAPKRRKLLNLFAAFILFVVIANSFDPIKNFFSDSENNDLEAVSTLVDEEGNLTEKVISSNGWDSLQMLPAVIEVTTIAGECRNSANSETCWTDGFAIVQKQLSDLKLSESQRRKALSEYLKLTDLSEERKAQLLTNSDKQLDKPVQPDETQQQAVNNEENSKYNQLEDKYQALETKYQTLEKSNTELTEQLTEAQQQPDFTVTGWLNSIATDLGISFGWAAVYFSLFTAWWRGQTPGKRLFGIRVLALNGKPLSLWESFERYGGYGAGFATGLLGFAQIIWEPNRMAIHDKISETVVIDVKKNKLIIPQKSQNAV